MRVVHLIDTFTVGGAERLLPTLGSALRERSLEVEFLALRASGPESVCDLLRGAGFTPRVLGIRGLRPGGVTAVRDALSEHRPDLVHAHLTYASILGPPAASCLGVPSIVTLHQLGALDWQQPAAAVREALFRAVVGRYPARVVAVSAAVARYYARRGIPGDRLDVIYNAIDTTPFEAALSPQGRARFLSDLGLAPAARVLVSVAMLRPGKGLGSLLRAMPAVRARFPEAVLLIVGDGPDRARLVGIADSLRLGPAVRFLGLRRDVPLILRAAELSIMPTRAAFSALPTVLIEAGAAGIPSVASDVGGVPELIRHEREGLLTPVGDSAGLADAIVRLLDDHVLRRRLGAAAREHARGFRPEGWADQLVDRYQRVSARDERSGAQPAAMTG